MELTMLLNDNVDHCIGLVMLILINYDDLLRIMEYGLVIILSNAWR